MRPPLPAVMSPRPCRERLPTEETLTAGAHLDGDKKVGEAPSES